MGEFVLYKDFADISEAQELLHSLDENKIEFSVVENAYEVDLTFSGNNTHQRNFQVLLKKNRFRKSQFVVGEISQRSNSD